MHVLAGRGLAGKKGSMFCVVSMGEKTAKTLEVAGGSGGNVEWTGHTGKVELPWEGEEELEVSIRQKDSGMLWSWRDVEIGACRINVGVLAEEGAYRGDLQVFADSAFAEGFLFVSLMCTSVFVRHPGALLQRIHAKTYKNFVAGAIASLASQESLEAFTTCQLGLQRVPQIFGTKTNGNWDEKHAKLFKDPLVTAVQAEHGALYSDSLALSTSGGPASERSSLCRGSCFLALLGYGIRQGKRRVFTYVVLDRGMAFSETGAAIAKDFLSKHAVHANAEPKVRMAGTFRICESREGTPVLVMDNDSGTYRPSPDHLPLLKEVLELNFPGLNILMLSVTEPQPEETKDFIGPNETLAEKGCVYAGQWKWRQATADELRGCSTNNQRDCLWEWSSGLGWRTYSNEDNLLLQKLRMQAEGTSGCTQTQDLSFAKGQMYKIDFMHGIQLNLATGKATRLRVVTGRYIPAWEILTSQENWIAFSLRDSVNIENAYAADKPFQLVWEGRQLRSFDFAKMECIEVAIESSRRLQIRRLQSTSVGGYASGATAYGAPAVAAMPLATPVHEGTGTGLTPMPAKQRGDAMPLNQQQQSSLLGSALPISALKPFSADPSLADISATSPASRRT